MCWTLGVCTVLTVLVTVIPLSRHTHWFVRGLDFPRLQIASVAAALLLAHVLILDFQLGNPGAFISWALAAATALCLAFQLWWILPYTRLWPQEVKQAQSTELDRQLSILTSNVLMTNRNADALIALVNRHQPDVLVTLESNQWWQEQLSVLEADMPHCVQCPLDNLYGMHVYSRLPFTNAETVFLVEEDVPSIHLCLELRGGEQVSMHFIHPAPPSPTENEESAERDAELVILARRVAKSLQKHDQPVVVTGDLNDVAWSATTRLFRKISGLLDPRVGRGMFNTFHADYFFLRWPLDHLFHSAHFTLENIQRLPYIGSDHFALFTTLIYAPERADKQEGIDACAEDSKRAQDIAEDQKVHHKDVPQPGK